MPVHKYNRYPRLPYERVATDQESWEDARRRLNAHSRKIRHRFSFVNLPFSSREIGQRFTPRLAWHFSFSGIPVCERHAKKSLNKVVTRPKTSWHSVFSAEKILSTAWLWFFERHSFLLSLCPPFLSFSCSLAIAEKSSLVCRWNESLTETLAPLQPVIVTLLLTWISKDWICRAYEFNCRNGRYFATISLNDRSDSLILTDRLEHWHGGSWLVGIYRAWNTYFILLIIKR